MTYRSSRKVLGIFLCLWAAGNSPAAADSSQLWGTAGERWKPDSRLPDFSFAGYRSGKEPVPYLPVKGNVKDFGAVGDGTTDDSEAFLKAITAIKDGALWIPAGRYRLTAVLKIKKSNFVLRGEGVDKTVLFFPKPLSQLVGNGKTLAPGGSWSWSGGLITFQGDDDDEMLTSVVLPAARGSRELTVGDAAGLGPGDTIRLLQSDRDGALGRLLYGDQAPSPRSFRKKTAIDFSSKIRSVKDKTLVLERPLRVEVRPSWKPFIYSDKPTVKDVGVEDLRIEFPESPYPGHHDEPGYNALEFSRVTDGWVRRVTILNADNGVFLRQGAKFCTLEGVRLTHGKTRARTGYGSDLGEPRTVEVVGHHGILMTGFSQDNLVTLFKIEGRYIHDLGVENGAAGNVFSAGQGLDLALDHHRRAPYENLFTEINAGEGTRLWEHGGDESDGPPSGVRETFWNIRAQHLEALPLWALQANFVGVPASPGPAVLGGSWIEAIPPEKLTPPNLYTAQRARK